MLTIYENPCVMDILEKAKSDILLMTGTPVKIKMFAVSDSAERVAYLREVVCLTCGVLWEEILSPSRKRHIATARFFYCVFAKAYLMQTVTKIAKDINRDHATVLHSLQAVDDWMCFDDRIRTTYQEIKSKLFPNEAKADA